MGRTSDSQITLYVCHTNARTFRYKTSQLSLMVDELGPDIFVVTETWPIEDVNCSLIIARHICIKSDSHKSQGRRRNNVCWMSFSCTIGHVRRA